MSKMSFAKFFFFLLKAEEIGRDGGERENRDTDRNRETETERD